MELPSKMLALVRRRTSNKEIQKRKMNMKRQLKGGNEMT